MFPGMAGKPDLREDLLRPGDTDGQEIVGYGIPATPHGEMARCDLGTHFGLWPSSVFNPRLKDLSGSRLRGSRPDPRAGYRHRCRSRPAADRRVRTPRR